MVDVRSPVELSFWAAASEQRRAKVLELRAWENQPQGLSRKTTYAVETLYDHKERKKLSPMFLLEFGDLPILLQWLLGIFTLCCMERRARALRGTRRWWGWFLDCSPRKAREYLKSLVDDEWLEELPQFKKHRSHGRDGEDLDHRQIETWYRPGDKLRKAFARYRADQARRSLPFTPKVGSIGRSDFDPYKAGKICQPSGYLQKLNPKEAAEAQHPARKKRQDATHASAACGSEKEAPSTAQEGLGAAEQPETAAAQPAAPASPAERPAPQGRPAPPAGLADKKASPAARPSTAANASGVDDIPIAYRDIFKRGIEYGIPVKALHKMFASDRDVFVSTLTLIASGSDFARRFK